MRDQRIFSWVFVLALRPSSYTEPYGARARDGVLSMKAFAQSHQTVPRPLDEV